MAFATIVSVTATAFGTAATAHLVGLPTLNSGDLAVLLWMSHDGGAPTTPTGWTQIHTFAVGSVSHSRVYTRKADGGEGATVDVVTGTNAFAAAQVYRVTGWSGTLTDVEMSENDGASENPNSPSLTPTFGAADHVWLTVSHSIDDDETVTAYPTNYTDGVNTLSGGGTNSGPAVGSARRELNATSENPGTFTISGGETWAAITIAIPPSAAAASQFPEYDRAGRQFLFSSPLVRM